MKNVLLCDYINNEKVSISSTKKKFFVSFKNLMIVHDLLVIGKLSR